MRNCRHTRASHRPHNAHSQLRIHTCVRTRRRARTQRAQPREIGMRAVRFLIAAGAALLKDLRAQAKQPVAPERVLTFLVQLLRDSAYAELSMHQKLHQLQQLLLTEMAGFERGLRTRSEEEGAFGKEGFRTRLAPTTRLSVVFQASQQSPSELLVMDESARGDDDLPTELRVKQTSRHNPLRRRNKRERAVS